MKKQINNTMIVLLALLTLGSCEEVMLKNDPPSDPVANFEELWNSVGNKYAFFEYKGIDWDSIYGIYREQVYADMTDRDLFDVLAGMLYELRDGHVNLSSSFDRSRNWRWFLDYPPNYNGNVVERNYLGEDHRITGPLKNQILDSVLYISYSSFGSEIQEKHLDFIVDRARSMKGVIIDIRSNGGGSLGNGEKLASVFIDEELTYGKSRVKNGPGKDGFSPWRDLTISPRDGKRYTGDIVVLCNRFSYSTSTFFAQMLKAAPNAVLFGDHTGGGGGIPAYGELPNGWIYRYSATQTLDLEGAQIEGGVKVDRRVDLVPEDEAEGVDSIIEAALEYFR